MMGFSGWTHVGYFGFKSIYANGAKRCLVDEKTGQSIFEFRVKRYRARRQQQKAISRNQDGKRSKDAGL